MWLTHWRLICTIFASTSLKDQSTLFPSSLPSLSPAVPVKDSSIIPFNTSSGTLQIPDTICHHLLTNQTLCKFELPLFCENIHFSYQPFLTFHPVESKLGKVFLPTSPGIYRPTQVAMLPISVPPVRSQDQHPPSSRQDTSSRNLRHTDAPRQNTHDMRTYRSHHQYSSAIDTITQALQNLDVPMYHVLVLAISLLYLPKEQFLHLLQLPVIMTILPRYSLL